ncbi:MFS transporter [Geodermatophilus sabuli]|uniref:MFS transporter n=1 Tax=Geodermatophilus sabuli TaxID=1564158 RepID=A0A7K3VUL5_9ACTN|nr:MFS transporter [Geodermatophilus sabuli]NEK56341.1 MFS transporter [Geodermatophilus sabuli]
MLPRALGGGRRAPVRGDGSSALPAALVLVATVVTVVGSLGAPLVPTVADAYDVPVPDAQWSLTLPVLVGAVATPVLGRLGDGPHRRTVVLAVLTVVAAGSVLAALPLDLGWLLAGRALQGVGLGLTPLTIAVARDALTGERAQRAAAALSITTVAGVGLGYPLAGWITQGWGLHAAFGCGAVLAAVVVVVAALVLPPASRASRRPLDLPGALLLGGGLGSALVLLAEGGDLGWTSTPALALAASAVALGGWFVARELRVPAPLVDLRQARQAGALVGHTTALLAGVANYVLLTVVTIIAQAPVSSGHGFAVPVVVSGLLLLPFSLGSLLAGRLVRDLDRPSGPGSALTVGAAVTATAFLWLLTGPERLWELFALMALAGTGIGGTYAVMPRLLFAVVPPEDTGSAMGLNQVLRYVGFATGSALSAGVLAAATEPGARLPSAAGYTAVSAVGCATCLAAAVLAGGLTLRAARRRQPAG